VDDRRAQRLALNETIFRKANEEMRATGDRMQHDFQAFMCECSDINCDENVPLSLDRYRKIRENPFLFVVVPGHEHLELEHVVDQAEGFNVVEKIGPGRDVAERDPLR
jgi:hypothetical protein